MTDPSPKVGYLAQQVDKLHADDPTEADIPRPANDPINVAVRIRRDLPDGWGDEVSRTPVELEPSSEIEILSDWVTPPAWPGSGEFATWECLRYEPL